MTTRIEKIAFAASLLIALIAGALFGWIGNSRYIASAPSKVREVREDSSTFHYINPLLFVDSPRAAPEYSKIRDALQKDAAAAKDGGDADDVSVYFRDLNQGKWTGVNEQDTYEPGSLLKVVTLIAYLKKAESDPSVIEKEMTYESHDDPGQYYKPAERLPSGSYSVEQLLERMIIDSDNTAAKLLLDGDKEGFAEAYATLRLPNIPATSTDPFMSPFAYSQVFRTLYNATYLGNELSEKSLFLLTNTDFPVGLVEGLPRGTIVAHKFGENTTQTPSGQTLSHELHDCGIVYYPGDPYFVCVMTRGQDFSKLESVISGISKDVYTAVAAMNAAPQAK